MPLTNDTTETAATAIDWDNVSTVPDRTGDIIYLDVTSGLASHSLISVVKL